MGSGSLGAVSLDAQFCVHLYSQASTATNRTTPRISEPVSQPSPMNGRFSTASLPLEATIAAEAVDVLVVAGDVFDHAQPSAEAQRQYYRFLARLADTGVRDVVIVGGNHDSPSRLDAPAELLGAPPPPPAPDLLGAPPARR